MELSNDTLALHDRMVAAKARVEREILADPRVTGIGVALCVRAGQLTNELVIRLCVRSRDAEGVDGLPAEIDGFPVEVVERVFKKTIARTSVESMATEDDTKRYDPLLGGISIGPSRSYNIAGTLGLMVRGTGVNEDAMMLSNYHVLCLEDGHAQVGDEICQEARCDNSLFWCGNCAKLSRWHVGDVMVGTQPYGIDAALALRSARQASLNDVLSIGVVAGTADPTIGMNVEKRGKSSEFTTGQIDSVSFTLAQDFGPPYGIVSLSNQITIRETTGGSFSLDGDSGSAIVDATTKNVVGLLWAGATDDTVTVANWISAVVQQMNIVI